MLSLIFPLIYLSAFALITWRLWQEYHHVQIVEGFTEEEKVILIRQVIALLVFLPFLFLYIMLFIIGQGFAVDILRNPYFSQFYLLISLVILGYVAVSSIRHRVSILRVRGQRKPLKGRSAVLSGILVIVLSISFGLIENGKPPALPGRHPKFDSYGNM
jgi:uncharacterized membrane protein